MEVRLKQPAIEHALRLYLAEQGISMDDKTLTVSFTAGRSKGGLTADVEILDNPHKSVQEPAPAKQPIPCEPIKRDTAVNSYVEAEDPVDAPEMFQEVPAEPVSDDKSEQPTSLFR